MKRKKNLLYYIYSALGSKSHPKCSRTSDRVAFIRLLITAQILITNFFIIYGVLRTHHFPNYEIQRHLSETKEKR
jgi:hypothetical protein